METISKQELDRLLTAMVQSAEGISDLLFITAKPPQVEVHGLLRSFASESILTNTRIEGLAKTIINNNVRLIQELADHGSCDCSYPLSDSQRFRVNIYRQNGNYAMVLRLLQPKMPSFELYEDNDLEPPGRRKQRSS